MRKGRGHNNRTTHNNQIDHGRGGALEAAKDDEDNDNGVGSGGGIDDNDSG